MAHICGKFLSRPQRTPCKACSKSPTEGASWKSHSVTFHHRWLRSIRTRGPRWTLALSCASASLGYFLPKSRRTSQKCSNWRSPGGYSSTGSPWAASSAEFRWWTPLSCFLPAFPPRWTCPSCSRCQRNWKIWSPKIPGAWPCAWCWEPSGSCKNPQRRFLFIFPGLSCFCSPAL